LLINDEEEEINEQCEVKLSLCGHLMTNSSGEPKSEKELSEAFEQFKLNYD
jgi:hypothetical protein